MNTKMTEQIPDALLETIRANQSSVMNICAGVRDALSELPEPERERWFTCFLSQIDAGDMEIPPENRSILLETEQARDIARLTNQILLNLIQSNPPEPDFYHALWLKYCDDLLVPDGEAQSVFLQCLWMDLRIPYFHRGSEGCTMDDDEYREIYQKLKPETLKKAQFYLSVRFRQKTQRTSLLMDLADSLDSDRERAVFWSFVITRIAASAQMYRKAEQAREEH